MRCDLDGRDFQLVIGHRNPTSLAVFGPYLFWLEPDSGQYFWPHCFGSGGCGQERVAYDKDLPLSDVCRHNFVSP